MVLDRYKQKVLPFYADFAEGLVFPQGTLGDEGSQYTFVGAQDGWLSLGCNIPTIQFEQGIDADVIKRIDDDRFDSTFVKHTLDFDHLFLQLCTTICRSRQGVSCLAQVARCHAAT